MTITFGDVLYRHDKLCTDDRPAVRVKNGDEQYLIALADTPITPIIHFPPDEHEFWAEFIGRREVNGKRLDYYWIQPLRKEQTP